MSLKRSHAAFQADDTPPTHAPFALFGTALPPYDPSANDDGSYLPVWKQTVTDERGRKRLHGAFTGGFSAGYFNTVGSKEGWTPATFVSSRNKRAKDGEGGKKEATVEDFMDEEDLAERDASLKLETQGGFAGLGGGGSAGGAGGMFADLFRVVGDETMGVKLLQRMGWRLGQGIGPKVKRRVKGDDRGEEHLFAPDDTRMIGFRRKTDRKGIGFAGEEKLSGGTHAEEDDDDDRDARILQTKSRVLVKSKPKIKKSGFGVGILNDTGSDDEDAYDMGPKISYNRIIGGNRKKRGGLTSTTSTIRKPILPSKVLRQHNNSLAGFRRCHDGRLPLDGFILSITLTPLLQAPSHPPPTVPPDWKPARLNQPATTLATSTSAAVSTTPLNPQTRAALLHEPQLPGKSIFDYLTPAARDRIAAATNNPNLPPARSERAPPGFKSNNPTPNNADLIPALEKATAEAALDRAWLPYAQDADAGKSARYRTFLSFRAGREETIPTRGKEMSVEEWTRELQEFAQAAKVFRPMDGVMGLRFASASSTGPPSGAAETAEPTDFGTKTGDAEAEEAARMGMFGPLTRRRLTFMPTRLMCKRFGFKAPAVVAGDGDGNGASRSFPAASAMSMGKAFVSAGTEGGNDADDVTTNGHSEGGGSAAATMVGGRGVVDVERNEALEGERPEEAVFREVFGGEDEDDV